MGTCRSQPLAARARACAQRVRAPDCQLRAFRSRLREAAEKAVLEAVDHLTGEMKSVRLCQRHTPHTAHSDCDCLKYVANWVQMEAEVRKRDRPLFRNDR